MLNQKHIRQVNLCGASQKLQLCWPNECSLGHPTFLTSLITSYSRSTQTWWRLAYGGLGDDPFQALHLPAFLCTGTQAGIAGRKLEVFHTLFLAHPRCVRLGPWLLSLVGKGSTGKHSPWVNGCCNWCWGGQCKQQGNTSQSFFPCVCVQWFTGHLQALNSV